MRIVVWGWEDVEDAAARDPEAWRIIDPTFNPDAERARAEAREGFREVTEQLRALRKPGRLLGEIKIPARRYHLLSERDVRA